MRLGLVPVDQGAVKSPRWVSIDLITEQHDHHQEPPEEERGGLSYADFLPGWHVKSACRDLSEPDRLFFGTEEPDVRPSLSVAAVQAARNICSVCPVFTACLTHALTTPEHYGVWAGTTGRQREKILAMIRAEKITLAEVVATLEAGNSYLSEAM